MGWFWNSGTNKDEEVIKNVIVSAMLPLPFMGE